MCYVYFKHMFLYLYVFISVQLMGLALKPINVLINIIIKKHGLIFIYELFPRARRDRNLA